MPIRILPAKDDKSKRTGNTGRQQQAMQARQESTSEGSKQAKKPISPSTRMKDRQLNEAAYKRDARKSTKTPRYGERYTPGMNTGGLTGNQAKLDKNKNNRIDAEDFKILRGEKGKIKKAALGAAMIGKKMVEDKMPGAFQIAKMKKKALGFRVGGSIRGKTLTDRMKNVDRGLIDKKTGKPTSMKAMRELKGFQPGEGTAEFNKRAKAMEGIKKAARATPAGRIALGVVGAGLAAKAFLDKKKKEAQEKNKNKKMGGGMMQLPTGYDKGGGADSGASSKGRRKKGAGPLSGKARTPQKGPRPGGRPTGRPRPYGGPMGAPPKDKGFELKYPGPARPGNPVVVYSVNKGSMVKARGGGLAKTKPTKMY